MLNTNKVATFFITFAIIFLTFLEIFFIFCALYFVVTHRNCTIITRAEQKYTVHMKYLGMDIYTRFAMWLVSFCINYTLVFFYTNISSFYINCRHVLFLFDFIINDLTSISWNKLNQVMKVYLHEFITTKRLCPIKIGNRMYKIVCENKWKNERKQIKVSQIM